MSSSSNVPSISRMSIVFTMIGMLAFGGQGGLLALVNRELVVRRGWLMENEITESFTYVQLLPGAVVVQVVAYLGWKLRRGPGAAAATVAFLLPSVAAMIGLAMMYQRLASVAGVSSALAGLTAAVVGLLAVGAARQATKTVTNVAGIVIAVAVLSGSVFLHVNPAIMIVAAGCAGIAAEALRGRSRTPDSTDSPGLGE